MELVSGHAELISVRSPLTSKAARGLGCEVSVSGPQESSLLDAGWPRLEVGIQRALESTAQQSSTRPVPCPANWSPGQASPVSSLKDCRLGWGEVMLMSPHAPLQPNNCKKKIRQP